MRKLLMASAAILAASGGLASAQTPVPPASPMQGQLAAPYGAGPNTNNNNSAWGIANTPTGSAAAGPLSTMRAPNTYAVPSPGTVVIHINGRLETGVVGNFTSVDKFTNSGGTYKLNPVGVATSLRLYFGMDGLANTGIRYGAHVELWENWGSATGASAGGVGSANNAGVAGNSFSSSQTMYVRRQFAYVGSDNVGILRIGGGDGVIGILDPCIFSSQCWDAGAGALNGGGGLSDFGPGGTSIPFAFVTQSGAEYTTQKLLYLSPQIYGFDLALNYVPARGNLANQGVGTTPLNAAMCTQANPLCINESSGNDSSRWTNMVGAGLRYQQTFGAVDFKTFGVWEVSSRNDLTAGAYANPGKTVASRASLGTTNLHYDALNFYEAGVAVTAANTTLAFEYIGGRDNAQLALAPTGGAPMNAGVAGITYANGPWILGTQVEIINSQGDARLTGLTQRHEFGAAFGGNYKLAPGVQWVTEYQYMQRHQGGFNFTSNSIGTTADSRGQGILSGLTVTW